jgi:hypothetical protein
MGNNKVIYDRTGEENINNQGSKMRIKEYRKFNDIDVEFEDGFISYNKNYNDFKKGAIRNKNLKHNQGKITDRTGEIKYNNRGNRMEIIRYNNSQDITIRFDNGYIMNCAYGDFKRGKPKYPNEKAKDWEKYIGKTNINSMGEKITIIDFRIKGDILVLFEDGYITNTTYQKFCNGHEKNPYSKSVYGVGYFGEGKYKSEVKGNKQKQYISWTCMLFRCYDKIGRIQNPTYNDVTVCDEWLNYQTFAQWYTDNYYEIKGERMEIDKDILIKGNKIYSPSTCCIVPHNINLLFIKNDRLRGNLPIGVNYHKNENKYIAQCHILESKYNITLGRFDTPEDAFYLGYKPFKENYIKQVANQYKDKIPQKLYNAMYNYIVEITD